MPASCACGRACASCVQRPDIRGRIPLTSADGPSPRTRIGWSDQGTGAPYSAALGVAGAPRIAADAVSPLGDRPPRHPSRYQSPQRCQQARRAMAAPSASFGAAAGAGSVASRSSLANAPCSSLALAKTPGARSLWAGACRRGTGVAGGVRAQPALQHPRGSPARPGLGAMSQPSQFWLRSEPDSDAPARGARLLSRGCRLPPHMLRRPGSTAWKGTERETAGHAGHAWAVKRVIRRGFVDRLSRVLSTRVTKNARWTLRPPTFAFQRRPVSSRFVLYRSAAPTAGNRPPGGLPWTGCTPRNAACSDPDCYRRRGTAPVHPRAPAGSSRGRTGVRSVT